MIVVITKDMQYIGVDSCADNRSISKVTKLSKRRLVSATEIFMKHRYGVYPLDSMSILAVEYGLCRCPVIDNSGRGKEHQWIQGAAK